MLSAAYTREHVFVDHVRPGLSVTSPPTPRLLHPGAWWLWALGLAVAASRTTNPLLLLVIAAVAGVVTVERRVPGPWGRSYGAFLKFGLVVIGVRIVLEIVMGGTDLGVALFTFPEIPLPSWMAGVRLGGLVTLDGLLFAIFDGLRIAVMLACVGAANALVNPSRLLRIVPSALYEAGVAVVVCMTLAPILITDVGRIRSARRLRGRSTRGVRAWAQMAMPLFSGALDRSIALAASMDSRGYGRMTGESPWQRRLNITLVGCGLLGVTIGLYGLLEGGAPGVAGVPVLGWPMVIVGSLAAVLGVTWAGRRVDRTRYRPDPWAAAEWITAVCGVVPATVFIAMGASPVLVGPLSPPGWPQMALAPLAAVLVGLIPAFATPRVPGQTTTATGAVPRAPQVAA
jgi:energy-coupling factor transport system permease protein